MGAVGRQARPRADHGLTTRSLRHMDPRSMSGSAPGNGSAAIIHLTPASPADHRQPRNAQSDPM